MREEDFGWVGKRMAAICLKYSYDRDTVERQFSIIDSNMGVPVVRKTMADLVEGHHYELASLFAEFLSKDRRSSYRALGATYTRKCANAPQESPHLLRLRDRANKGLSCFVVKYAVSNPWLKDIVSVAKCVRIFAATSEQAAQRARDHAAALIPGGKAVNVRVVNILDDPEAEKAEVTVIKMECEGTKVLATAEDKSFADASKTVQKWRARFKESHPHAGVHIKVEWESGHSYAFMDTLARVAGRAANGLATVIEQDIAFVFGEFVYADRSAAEQARLYDELVGMGAKEHCGSVRAACLLRDSRGTANGSSG